MAIEQTISLTEKSCVDFSQALLGMARWFFLAGLFFVVFSPTTLYLIVLSALLVLPCRGYCAQLSHLWRWSPIRWGGAYLGVVLLGVVYTQSSLATVDKEILVTILPILVFPLLFPAFRDPVWCRRILLTLLLSGVCVAIRALLNKYGWVPGAWRGFFLLKNHHLQQAATLSAFGVYLALHLSLTARSKGRKIGLIVLSVSLVIALLVGQPERVGMVLAMVSLLLFAFFHIRSRKIIVSAGLGVVLLLILVFHYSDTVKAQVAEFIGGIQKVEAGLHQPSILKSKEPTVARVRSNLLAMELSSVHPLMGFGTGAFNGRKKYGNSVPTVPGHQAMADILGQGVPETGFLFILLRHGWVGLVIFGLYLLSWWWRGRTSGKDNAALILAVLVILALANCSYPASNHSRPWVWLFAALIAGYGAATGLTKKDEMNENTLNTD